MTVRRWFFHASVSSVLILAVGSCAPTAEDPDEDVSSATESRLIEAPAAARVRSARRAFNQAIVERDLDVIDALLMPTYHIVTGRSTQYEGHDANVAMWRTMFATDSTMLYVRTARAVRVNDTFGLAEELGDWAGNYTANGQPGEASGVYAAKWQRSTDGRWLLQSEVFTTLECSGGSEACRPPDPIGN